MTIKVKPLKGTSRTLAEWKAFACRDDCLDRMVPSDLRCILSAIEAVDPATIRAEALREAADTFNGFAVMRKMWSAGEVYTAILALIDKEQDQ